MPEQISAVPFYVRASEQGWAVIDTESDAAVEQHNDVRSALDAIDVKASANVMPDGEWRWLDATEEEDEPAQDGVRISAESIWEMAGKLNGRPNPVPVDGGSVAGLLPSEVHGTADDSGTLANGWAHVGLPVVDAGGGTHLYLRVELLPEIANEVDRGRLEHP